MGSKREPRHTRLGTRPGLGRPGSGSPAGAVGRRRGRRWEQSSGEGEAQWSGGLASGDLRAATYRERRGREGRTAGERRRRGGAVHRRLG
jgi:hypothetical protein